MKEREKMKEGMNKRKKEEVCILQNFLSLVPENYRG